MWEMRLLLAISELQGIRYESVETATILTLIPTRARKAGCMRLSSTTYDETAFSEAAALDRFVPHLVAPREAYSGSPENEKNRGVYNRLLHFTIRRLYFIEYFYSSLEEKRLASHCLLDPCIFGRTLSDHGLADRCKL